jgi:hypothetical protein
VIFKRTFFEKLKIIWKTKNFKTNIIHNFIYNPKSKYILKIWIEKLHCRQELQDQHKYSREATPKNNEKPLVLFLLLLFKTSTLANQPNLKTNLFLKKKTKEKKFLHTHWTLKKNTSKKCKFPHFTVSEFHTFTSASFSTTHGTHQSAVTSSGVVQAFFFSFDRSFFRSFFFVFRSFFSSLSKELLQVFFSFFFYFFFYHFISWAMRAWGAAGQQVRWTESLNRLMDRWSVLDSW